jgi:RNA polymerase sigma factor (sigma-70 family)
MNGEVRAGVVKPTRLFETTHWSIIRRAQHNSATALNHLFVQYREPMIVHLLGKQHTRDEAEESVQGFCVHLLKKDFLVNVAEQKGKFRTFLLTALNNYLRDQIDHARAIKRGEGRVPESLDEVDADGVPNLSPVSPGLTADLEYDKAWAQTVLRNSLRRLEEESTHSGHGSLCRALEPVLFDDETSPSYREVAAQLGMTEGAVKVAAHRLRQRLRGLIREEIMQTVCDEAELEEELAYLISLFGR